MKKKYRFKNPEAWEKFSRHNELKLCNMIYPVCKYPNWFSIERDENDAPMVVDSDGNHRYHFGWITAFSRGEIELYLDTDSTIDLANDTSPIDMIENASQSDMMEWAMKNPSMMEYIKNKFVQHKIKKMEISLTNELKEISIRGDRIYTKLEQIGSSVTRSNFNVDNEE